MAKYKEEPMNRASRLFRTFLVAALIAAASLTTTVPVAGQVADTEPNNTCATAEDVGTPTLPFTLNGNLDVITPTMDIDFFRITATPSATFQVDLEGQVTGAGTLGDPLIGVFDSACGLITANDDGGVSPNARAQLTVPADGVLVLAATSCCDFEFVGAGFGNGSYRLTISQLATANSISGRVVDANTGSPLGSAGYADLYRCSDGLCGVYVATQYIDTEGMFQFTTGSGFPLIVGTYALYIWAGPAYQPIMTTPFAVTEGQDYNAGDIGLAPIVAIGGIGGRVVDAATGTPLRGDIPPFAIVHLQQCDPSFGCAEIASLFTDIEGRFHFTSDFFGSPLPPGEYTVVASADQYQNTVIGSFFVAEGQDLDLGIISLNPLNVRFSEIRPCGNLPPEGGTCSFSFRLTNVFTTPLSGLAWANVQAQTPTGTNATNFQPGAPAWLVLAPGESQVAQFEFKVSSRVQDSTLICVQGFASQGNDFFDVVGQRNLFCISKGLTGFQLLSEAHTREQAQLRLKHQAPPGRPATGR
jgi:hypothetical protein